MYCVLFLFLIAIFNAILSRCAIAPAPVTITSPDATGIGFGSDVLRDTILRRTARIAASAPGCSYANHQCFWTIFARPAEYHKRLYPPCSQLANTSWLVLDKWTWLSTLTTQLNGTK